MTPEEQDDNISFRVFMAETVVYRKEQKDRMDRIVVKMDRIFNKLESLPCRERAYLPDQVKAIWVFIGGIILAIIAEWVKK